MKTKMNKDLVFITIAREAFKGDFIELSAEDVEKLEKMLKVAKANILGDGVKVIITHKEKKNLDV